MADKVRVKFNKAYSKWNAGEMAGFQPHIASALTSGNRPVAGLCDAEGNYLTAAESELTGKAMAKAVALRELTVEQLKEALRELGEPLSGNKSDLIDRLEAAQAG